MKIIRPEQNKPMREDTKSHSPKYVRGNRGTCGPHVQELLFVRHTVTLFGWICSLPVACYVFHALGSLHACSIFHSLVVLPTGSCRCPSRDCLMASWSFSTCPGLLAFPLKCGQKPQSPRNFHSVCLRNQHCMAGAASVNSTWAHMDPGCGRFSVLLAKHGTFSSFSDVVKHPANGLFEVAGHIKSAARNHGVGC